LRLCLYPVAVLIAFVASACGDSSASPGGSQPVATVTVSLGNPSLGAGLTTAATATLRDASGNVLTGRTVIWSSSAPSAASVSSSGVVTGLAAGTATITATSEGKSGGTPITVVVNPVETVTVTLANAALTQGGSTQAVATLRDAGGNLVTGRAVAWTSAAAGVAAVWPSGAVVAMGPGSVLITATCEGKSGSAVLTVTADPVASVTVSLATPRVGVGGLSQGAAVLRDASGTVLSGRIVTWSSSNLAVATVLATGGMVTGVGLGTSTITATSEGFMGSATITVAALYPVTALFQTVAPQATVTQPPAVKVTDGSGNPISGASVTFAVTAGGGSVSPGSVVTDATGVASLASWTFGPAGTQAVTASTVAVPGVTVDFAGLSRPTSAGYDITLRITPGTSMTTRQLRAFVDAKERIQELVVGDVPDSFVSLTVGEMARCGGPAIAETVDDVIIYAEVAPIDGPGNILGQAGPCFIRNEAPGFPIVGHMQFDSADLPALETKGLLEATILHEMMHVLGFGTLWASAGYLAGDGTSSVHFSGPSALSAFDTYNGGTTYPGSKVPVEDTGGTGTVNSHWREADFDDELMTGFLDKDVPKPFSATTVKSMEDIGYRVDVTRADPFRWGAATVALRAALRGAGLGPVEPPIQLVDDVRRTPPVVLGPDGRPLFP
jgi:uncharacterized protein YjdB